MLGELLIRWTARLAVACYVGRLLCDAGQVRFLSSQLAARWWWTCGCVCFVAHVVCAFHFEHNWDHFAALSHTAKRTAELTGWQSGIGLYVNYAFLGLWVADAAMWWRDLSWPENRLIYWTVQGVFAFLMLQATAVFGPPFWTPIVLLVLTSLIALSAQRSKLPNVSSGADPSEFQANDVESRA